MINLQPEQIESLRKSIGLKYIDLEILTGIHRVKLSDIEKLKKSPAPHELQLIAEALNKIEKLLPKKEVKIKSPKKRVKCSCGRTAYSNGLCAACYYKEWVKNNREKVNKYQRDRNRRLKLNRSK